MIVRCSNTPWGYFNWPTSGLGGSARSNPGHTWAGVVEVDSHGIRHWPRRTRLYHKRPPVHTFFEPLHMLVKAKRKRLSLADL
jgi:hypothetical protein